MVDGIVRPFIVETHVLAMQKQLIGLGFPCPPSGATVVAVPAVEEVVVARAIPDDVEEPADEADVVRDPKPKGTLEEAQSRGGIA